MPHEDGRRNVKICHMNPADFAAKRTNPKRNVLTAQWAFLFLFFNDSG